MTAASLLKQEITRRLNGQCRIDVATGVGLSLHGEKQEGYSCADCTAPCGDFHESPVGDGFTLIQKGGTVQLRWACPGCGKTVHEDSSILRAHMDAAEIQRDPYCHCCRTRGSGAAE